jgi:hypothetical protein
MKYLLTLLIAGALSCNDGANDFSIESRVKHYMTDSIVPRFNDPKSYEFVSMEVDTFKGSDYVKRLSSSTTESIKKEADSLASQRGFMDSVLHVKINVSYRGKNKMGALILDQIKLRYFPSLNAIKE